jgi:hypothetical protein
MGHDFRQLLHCTAKSSKRVARRILSYRTPRRHLLTLLLAIAGLSGSRNVLANASISQQAELAKLDAEIARESPSASDTLAEASPALIRLVEKRRDVESKRTKRFRNYVVVSVACLGLFAYSAIGAAIALVVHLKST